MKEEYRFEIVPEDIEDLEREANFCLGIGPYAPKKKEATTPEPEPEPAPPEPEPKVPTWERRRAEGKCADCEEPPEPGQTRCARHRARAARYAAAARQTAVAQGKCPRCRKRPVEAGRYRCAKCAEEHASDIRDARAADVARHGRRKAR